MRQPEYCYICPDNRDEICPLPSRRVKLFEGLIDSASGIAPEDMIAAGAHYVPSEAIALAQNTENIEPLPTRAEQRAARIAICVEMHQSLGPLIGFSD
jgi:hypothetical protein